MKCVLICCFNIYDLRIRPIENFLKSKGFECQYITSDFDHNKKTEYVSERKGSIQLSVIKYKKNLSVTRLVSHFIFAKKAVQEVKRLKPDLVYVILPPNILASFLSRYKSNHNVKLIYDIYDLWPETFPSRKSKNILSVPFKIWRNLRDKNLSSADLVITECNLFQEVLKNVLKDVRTETLYLSKDDYNLGIPKILDETDKIHLCYLGSINNIIDIPLIKKIIKEINKRKPVIFHIIGDGENRERLIREVTDVGAKVEYYGKIYDPQQKMKIFNKCHFGLNIMKESVCVGLTMKSIDYFQSSLPIINNIPADTSKIVEDYSVGFNIDNNNLEELAVKISSIETDDLFKMRENTNMVFKKLFSTEAANKNLDVILKGIGV